MYTLRPRTNRDIQKRPATQGSSIFVQTNGGAVPATLLHEKTSPKNKGGMSYKSTTIATVVQKLNSRFFIPAIQRPFVWDEQKVIKLLDSLMKGLADAKTPPEKIVASLRDPQLQLGLLLRFGLAGLLALPFWHAPALAHWGGLSSAKALFFSFVACWRNWRAFTVYALTWTGVILGFAVLVNLMFLMLGQMRLIGVVALPASLLFSTVFYASLYFTFADCFVQYDPPTTIQESL